MRVYNISDTFQRQEVQSAINQIKSNNPSLSDDDIERQVLTAWSSLVGSNQEVNVQNLLSETAKASQAASGGGQVEAAPIPAFRPTDAQRSSLTPQTGLGQGALELQALSNKIQEREYIKESTMAEAQSGRFSGGSMRANIAGIGMGGGQPLGPQTSFPYHAYKGKDSVYRSTKNSAVDFLESFSYALLDTASVGLLGLLGSGAGKLSKKLGGKDFWNESFLNEWRTAETSAGEWGRGIGGLIGFVGPMAAGGLARAGVKGAAALAKSGQATGRAKSVANFFNPFSQQAGVHKVFSAPAKTVAGVVTRGAKKKANKAILENINKLLGTVEGA